jgi:hypothetical protein
MEVLTRAADALDRAAAGPRHALIQASLGDGLVLVPASWCGPYGFENDSGSTFYVFARLDLWLLPHELVNEHSDLIQKAMQGEVAAREALRSQASEIAALMTEPAQQLCVVDVSPALDGTLLLAMRGPSAVHTLKAVLPPGLNRPVQIAGVRGLGLPGDACANALPDRLALWDLLARMAEHQRRRALDPAEMPRNPGKVPPTSTATSTGSLWPPIK